MAKIIREATVHSKPENVKRYLSGKVVFETYLQEADEPNQNKRIYPKSVLEQAVARIQDSIDRRAFIGELDHPISTNQVRQTTVLYKECSHIIRKVWWEGLLLRGLVETTPYTENGKILSGLIMDNVPVGFSLRGLADVQDNGQYMLVQSPLLMIGYDCVSQPSHHKATIQEVKSESVSIVNESRNLICTSDGHCYLPDYFDELVESSIIKIQKKFI